jgi:hypothetical protein
MEMGNIHPRGATGPEQNGPSEGHECKVGHSWPAPVHLKILKMIRLNSML